MQRERKIWSVVIQNSHSFCGFFLINSKFVFSHFIFFSKTEENLELPEQMNFLNILYGPTNHMPKIALLNRQFIKTVPALGKCIFLV